MNVYKEFAAKPTKLMDFYIGISINVSTLENRRSKVKLITMYKILNDNLDVPKNDFIPNYHPSRQGYFNQPQTLIDFYKFSFFPSVIRLWNTLSPLYN